MYVKTTLSCVAVMFHISGLVVRFQKIIALLSEHSSKKIGSSLTFIVTNLLPIRELNNYLLNDWCTSNIKFHLSHGIDGFILILHFQNYLFEFDVTWTFVWKYTELCFQLNAQHIQCNTIQKPVFSTSQMRPYSQIVWGWKNSCLRHLENTDLQWTWLLASTLLRTCCTWPKWIL